MQAIINNLSGLTIAVTTNPVGCLLAFWREPRFYLETVLVFELLFSSVIKAFLEKIYP